MSGLVKARAGQCFTKKVSWLHHDTPTWTDRSGWHPDLVAPVRALLDEVRAVVEPGALLVAPIIPPNWYQFSEHMAAADGVRAAILFDIVLGEMVCRLDTIEAIPE